jgi:hypothetical protein
MGAKDPSVVLPIEKLNFYEKYMNYVDNLKDTLQYLRINEERVIELAFNVPQLFGDNIVDFVILSKET